MNIYKHEPQCTTHTQHNKTIQTPETNLPQSQLERQSLLHISKTYSNSTKRHNTATECIQYPEFH
jgi:hypothetical protein